MKRYLLILTLISVAVSASFSQLSGRTSIFKLPYWTTGAKLYAGTPNDSSQSVDGLNNAFYRLEMLLSRNIDGNGYIKSVIQGGTGNLNINSGSQSGTPTRVVLADSLYGSYSAYFEGNGLFEGNLYIGGYIQLDSIIATNNVTFSDTVSFFDHVNVFGSLYASDTIIAGNTGGSFGILRLYTHTFGPLQTYITTVKGSSSPTANRSITFPDLSGAVALADADQDLSDLGEVTADSVTVSGKIETGTYIRINESADSPNGSINDADTFVYKNGGGEYYYIIKYNDAGTIRYRYMRLDGTTATWTHATTLP